LAALQWDGTNEAQIRDFLGPFQKSITVKEESPHYKTPRQLVIEVSWGTLFVKEGDYVTRDDMGHVSYNSAETFLVYFEREKGSI
jgi:hypothetical protein